MKTNGTESKARKAVNVKSDSKNKSAPKGASSSTGPKDRTAEESTELFKYRLLGAVVTFVLLALFGPELLDGSGRVHTAEIIEIPEAPQLPAPPLLKPPSPLGTGFNDQIADTPLKPNKVLNEKVSTASKEISKTPQPDTPVKPNLPKKASALATSKPAWTLQLATFSQPKNAYALRERLTKDGFNSYSRLIKDSSGGTRYQVYVGPELSKDKMLIVKKQLSRKLKLKDGIIKPYVP